MKRARQRVTDNKAELFRAKTKFPRRNIVTHEDVELVKCRVMTSRYKESNEV